MAVLSDADIKKEIGRGGIIITPEPQEEAFGPNSLDLRLSDEFFFYKKKFISGSKAAIDLAKTGYKAVTERKNCRSLVIKPGEICLGMTIEEVCLPSDIMASIGGKSGIGRMGLTVHITAPFHHAGASNRIMLEIKNEGPLNLRLTSGMRICQIVFERLETPASIPYSKVGRVVKGQK